ncbi:MAG: class I SAM-dependent methyltransferase [bacterium]|nr:class I SAM-dependent methyltransferase [bacterium]
MSERKYWENKWASSENKPPNEFAKRAYAAIRKRNHKTLLDLGCGDGRDSRYFAGKGLRVSALDFSRSGIENLKSLHPAIKTYLADIRRLKFKRDSFDIIYAHLSLHYFNDKETTEIFKNLYRLLKKGGLIFVKCKSTDDALSGKGKKIGPDMYHKEHLRHFFSKEYMTGKLKKFKILKLRKTSSVYHTYKSSFIEATATK